VELIIGLPAHAGHAFHQVQQLLPHRFGGADGDEQAVHVPRLGFRGDCV